MKRTTLPRALAIVVLACVVGVLTVTAGCSGSVTPQGGLMLVLRTDGTLTQADRLHLEITSTTGATTYRNADYLIPSQITLPTTLGVATNGNATASVIVNASLWAGTTLLDDRENQIFEIPTDRVAELDLVFSSICTPRATEEADGGAGSSCPAQDTCDPTTGGCTASTVNAGQLPTFSGDAGGTGLGEPSDSSVDATGDSGIDATVPNSSDSGSDTGADGTASEAGHALAISPASQTISVTAGASTPTGVFSVTLGGQPVNATWTVDRADVGSVTTGPASTCTFTPHGATGGLATITASYAGQSAQSQLLVKLTSQQNGVTASEGPQTVTSVAQLSAGGGVGGVGGEGLGPGVSDPATLAALASASNDAGTGGLALLYPYDKTVWPRGTPAPLLMWTWATNDADAIQIHLTTTSGSFSYTGTFGRPAILATTGGSYIRSPIPQDVWTMATNSAGGLTPTGVRDQLTLSLTLAKSGVGYGPVTQTWNIAPGTFAGSIYYTSYGTHLVQNWTNLDKAGNAVGAAVVAVRAGVVSPTLVAGTNSPLGSNGKPSDDTGCRVCHTVSARGRWLIAQAEQGTPGDGLSTLYDLSAGSGPTALAQSGVFAFAAMTSTGNYALTDAVDPANTNPAITNAAENTATSSFWQFGPSPSAATLTGLPSGIAAGSPTYSPDDTMVAYIEATGSTATAHGPLDVANYDATTHVFANVRSLISVADAGSAPQTTAGFALGNPTFLPDTSALLFENGLRKSQTDTVLVTQEGARSELWWIPLGSSSQASPLLALNGRAPTTLSYLPVLANNHGVSGASDPRDSYSELGWDDTTLNYEPRVLPIVVGGYAWVVFTSRRAYGNELTAVPWNSWPPNYDTTSLAQAPTKKLWIAAIDLNAPSGTDPSHPAFYMPGQEILAANSRGDWVLDPCRQDGVSCGSGDECCNGFCESMDGGLVCASAPVGSACSKTQEACTVSADCCDATQHCIAGFCAMAPPN